MFEDTAVEELAGMVRRLAELPAASGDGERIDRIAVLEELKAAAAAAQLSEVAAFAVSQEAANKAAGVKSRQARRGVPEQIGLARRVAPATAARQVSQAQTLLEQLPGTFKLLRRGEISEWVATIVVTETSHLSPGDRLLVDKQLAEQLVGLSPRRAQATARRLTIRIDPAGAVARAGKARADRRVGIRPAPDTMAVLSALLPCEQGVGVYAALRKHADAAIAAGDKRTRGQIMADTLVERITGQATAGAVDAEIGLVMTDAALLRGDDEPAELAGYGPVPAQLARDLAGAADDHDEPTPSKASDPPAARAHRARVWLRRLFTDPVTGVITDCDPRRRRFDGVLARLLVYRDWTCRDPFCDAPIRHLDHITAHSVGGPTIAANGRGVCARGNFVKQMPGWTTRLLDPDRHIVETTTPTGHRYRSTPPPAPGCT
jgi:hypothetical protein